MILYALATGVVFYVVAWLVGVAAKEATKPLRKRSAAVVGTATLGRAARVVWRKPGVVLDRVAVSYLVVTGLGVAVVGMFRPELLRAVAAAGFAALCVGFVVWDQKLTGGRRWRDVFADMVRADDVRRAIADTNPDARTGAVKVRGGRVEAALEHVGPVDHERVGQALHAPHVELVPGSELGRSTVVVHDAVPAPEVDPWVALSTVQRWPGPRFEAHDADIPVGVDIHGRVVHLPFPGVGGKHLLVGGATGAGKSGLMAALLAELSFRPHIRFMFGDPKYVELALWEPRGAVLAAGVAETGKLLEQVHAEMMSRYQWLQGKRRRKWEVGADGDQIMLVIDELAAVTSGAGKGPRIDALNQIIAMGRAAAVGLICCAQRPSYQLIPTDVRDNFRSRICLGTESDDQTDMVLGSKTRWPAHEIPPSLPGVAYVRIDREATLCRSYWLEDDDIDRVAAATAHLKGA